MDKKSHRLSPTRAALAGLALAALPMASFAFVSVGVSINIAPPALPVYVQPPCPAVGYIWTPGYWAYGDDDYYWVPGTWVLAPSPGFLWTPGYWGWGGGVYAWHEGYWGPHVGFYGGVNYGYGYGGVGFEGGYWRGGAFFYNRSVANLGGVHVTNVYNKTVINNVNVTRVSFNGGEGGLHARPNSHEMAAEHDHHVAFTSMQREHEHAAFGNHDLRASVNGGKPRIAATERPGVFSGKGVVAARAGAPYHGGNEHGGTGHGPDVHAANDHGGPGRGPDTHAGDQHGGPSGHGGPDHVANRSDRPPGAAGSAEVHGGAGGGAGGAENHGTRATANGTANHSGGPSGHGGPGANGAARGSEFHAGGAGSNGAAHGESAHVAGRNDRPPGAGGAEVHGGTGGGPSMGGSAGGGHNEPSHVAVAHNDHAAGPSGGAPRGPQPHVNQGNQMHNTTQGPRPGGSAQPSPHQFNGGGGGGGGGGQPGPRPQSAPHPQSQPQSQPHPQNAPRPENHRGGGEPHGQSRPQAAPQGRGGQHEQNHGRR